MSDLTISINCDVRPDDETSVSCLTTTGCVRPDDETSASRLSAPAEQFDTDSVTVKTAVKTAYIYCARAARRLRWFITVKASAFAVVLESRVRAFMNNVFPRTGADILRQSAILNI